MLNRIKKIILAITLLFSSSPTTSVSNVEPHINAGVTRDIEEIKAQLSVEASNVEVVSESEESDLDENEYIYIRCTGYVLKGTTASGKEVYDGCVATCDEWFGKTIDVYAANEDGSVGEYIRTLHADDKGGELISSGKRIDIWFPSIEAAREHISKYGDYVYIVVRGDNNEDKN